MMKRHKKDEPLSCGEGFYVNRHAIPGFFQAVTNKCLTFSSCDWPSLGYWRLFIHVIIHSSNRLSCVEWSECFSLDRISLEAAVTLGQDQRFIHHQPERVTPSRSCSHWWRLVSCSRFSSNNRVAGCGSVSSNR